MSAVAEIAAQDPTSPAWKSHDEYYLPFRKIDTILDGPTEVADKPFEYIGDVFRDEDEARLSSGLVALLVAAIEPHTPITDFAAAERALLGSPQWFNIVDTAQQLLRLFRSPD